MKLFHILFLTSAIALTSNQAFGSQLVQAVCRIILTDGTQVEGIIRLGNDEDGGEYYEYGNGWCFINGETSFDLFGPYFKKITRQSSGNYTLSTQIRTTEFANVKTLYFLEGNGTHTRNRARKTKVNTKSPRPYLEHTWKSKHRAEYTLCDSITLYQSIAPTGIVGQEQHPKIITIKVSEISSFELLDKPDQKWLDIIDSNRTEVAKNHTTDLSHLAWYHIRY